MVIQGVTLHWEKKDREGERREIEKGWKER